MNEIFAHLGSFCLYVPSFFTLGIFPSPLRRLFFFVFVFVIDWAKGGDALAPSAPPSPSMELEALQVRNGSLHSIGDVSLP